MSQQHLHPSPEALQAAIQDKSRLVNRLVDELHRVVVGQEQLIERLLIGLFCNGHILLEGAPGLAKTLTVSTLAKALSLRFQRIQFTPDLLPADLVGTMIYNPRESKFEVKQGPIFANLVLADEINRSPAKVQSALLEAMQERQVTIGGNTYVLDKPFLVLATQNPIEQEGTYPLPEAQVDRFMLKVHVDYPTYDQELDIMRRMARTEAKHEVKPVLQAQDIFAIRGLIDQIDLAERLERYILDLVMATRYPQQYGLGRFADFVEFGVSPRATIALNLAARAHAFLQQRPYVLPEDIKAVAPDVLNHRLILSYEAAAERVTARSCVDHLLRTVPIPA